MCNDHGFSRVCPTGDSFADMKPPETRRCPECNGDAEVPKEGGPVLFDSEVEMVPCKNCDGTGQVPA